MKIKDWLIPKDKVFYDLLDEHIDLVVKAAHRFHRDLSTNQFSDKTVSLIEKLETDADAIIVTVFNKLNQTFITPMDHEDLGNLIISADDLIDLIQASARRIKIYKLNGHSPEVKKFVAIINTMIQESQQLVKKIKQLSQHEMESNARKIHRLENQADNLLLDCLERLTREKNIRLLIQKKEVFEILETLTDKIEEFCNLTQKVVMKNL